MREPKIKYGIKTDKLHSGFSLGMFFTVAPINQFTECYLLIHLGFWYVAIGRFWE